MSAFHLFLNALVSVCLSVFCSVCLYCVVRLSLFMCSLLHSSLIASIPSFIPFILLVFFHLFVHPFFVLMIVFRRCLSFFYCALYLLFMLLVCLLHVSLALWLCAPRLYFIVSSLLLYFGISCLYDCLFRALVILDLCIISFLSYMHVFRCYVCIFGFYVFMSAFYFVFMSVFV